MIRYTLLSAVAAVAMGIFSASDAAAVDRFAKVRIDNTSDVPPNFHAGGNHVKIMRLSLGIACSSRAE